MSGSCFHGKLTERGALNLKQKIYRIRMHFLDREAGLPVFFKYAYLIIFILTAVFFFMIFE